MIGGSHKALLLSAAIAVAAVTVAAYLPGMSAGFYFDDTPNILEPPSFRWTAINFENFSRSLTEVVLPSRPIANISFAVNHRYSGFDPAPYHWTNLLIHLAVGLALYWVIRLFQRHHTENINGQWLALLAVLLFLVHPLNIQAVTYVVQRMTSMATLFFLVALGSYLKARYHSNFRRKTAWLVLAGICFLFSIGSKETGYLLVPLILLYEVCFHYSDWRARLWTGASRRGRIALIGVSALAAILAASFAYNLLDGRIYWLDTMPGRDFSGYERVLTQLRVQFFYLSLLVWPAPSRLNLDHDFLLSRSLLDPVSTALALVVWTIVLFWALRNMTSRPRIVFPLLAYLLLHAIESAPISLELVFEHRMYLPMTMLAVLIALNFQSLPRTWHRRSYVAIIGAAVLLAGATHHRNEVWGDPVAFYRDTASKSPNKFRPQYNLGTNLGPAGMLEEARASLEKAIEIQPDHSEAHNQLANIYMMENQPDIAEREYRLAIEHNPKNAEALFNLAKLLEVQNRQAEQLEILRKFIAHAPPHLERQKQWAIYYLKIHGASQP